MEQEHLHVQTSPGSSWSPVAVYVSALAAGVVLIVTKAASLPEASGYVAPFLLVYEKLVQRGS